LLTSTSKCSYTRYG